MYCITDEQIDYILDDISARGIGLDSLQQNLVDHICCIIEQELEENGDFESFYQSTIRRFYKHELWEIEEETLTLLTFKNYYAMKKAVMISGAFSVSTFIVGSFFKIMHWPGAGMLLFLGIIVASFLFLPLIFVLKSRESGQKRDRLIFGLGTADGILFSVSVLFKVMHWPGGNMLWLIAIAVLFFLFIPAYFFTGIRRSETKANTIISTVLLVMAGGLLFTLTNIRKSRALTEDELHGYYRNEQLLQRMLSQSNDPLMIPNPETTKLAFEIQDLCRQAKGMIFRKQIGKDQLPANFRELELRVEDSELGLSFTSQEAGGVLIQQLKSAVVRYNALQGQREDRKIPMDHSLLQVETPQLMNYAVLNALNDMTQIQLFLAQSEQCYRLIH